MKCKKDTCQIRDRKKNKTVYDDDNGDDDGELFLWYGWPTKGV